MATELEEIYDDLPDEEQVDETVIEPPAGYKPLSAKQRLDWNNFLRFLNQEKKIGGSKELDDRSRERGLELLDEYKRDHPDFSIDRKTIPYVQYEFQELKNSGKVPGFEPVGRLKTIMGKYASNREVSPVDGWIGSLTSRQGYPEIESFSEDPEKRRWGVDYEGANELERRLNP